MLIDSHCHLNNPELIGDVAAVLRRAELMGVTRMLSVCTTLNEAPEIQALAARYPMVNCSVGVHPHYAQEALEAGELVLQERLAGLIAGPGVVALGETGLDYYYENSPREAQQAAFRTHIALAKKYDLPLIIHTRDADADTIALLAQEKGKIRGVIHCFSGTQWLAQQALDLGFYISISGIATFKNATDIRRIIQDVVPLDRLLVETDAPYLAPLPHRGKRNEPAFVVHVAEMVAQLKCISMHTLQQQSTENYLSLFGWRSLDDQGQNPVTLN